MYKVKVYFTDLQDGGHPYQVGDVFPRAGKEVSKERLAELSGTKNKRGVALIEEVKEPAKAEEPEEVKEPEEAEKPEEVKAVVKKPVLKKKKG